MTDSRAGRAADLAGVHANHRAFWRQLARACGGSSEEIPGGLLVATGIPAAPFNQVHCDAGADHRVTATADRAAAFFAGRGLPWRLICERADPAAGLIAGRLGAGPGERDPIMTLALGPPALPEPVPDLDITTATDVAGLRAFVDGAAASYRMDPALLRPLARRDALADPDLRFYLGRIGRQCVAVAIGVQHVGTVGVYFVGVRRGFRRRGLGRAISARVIRDGAAAGAHTAVLQSTRAGYPLYTDLGFRPVGDYYLWDIPQAGEAGQPGAGPSGRG